MNDTEKFELLKKKIDNLNVKKLASENEAKRLNEELEKCKQEVKEVYGVDITDFAKAIETMKNEYESEMKQLEQLVLEAENKMEVNDK